MCTEFKSKKDICFFRFALGFSNRNLTEIYTELELKNSATYSLEGHADTKGTCHCVHIILASVVQTLDSAIHQINHYPRDKYYGNQLRYPLNSDLSGGQRYPTFENPGPGVRFKRALRKKKPKGHMLWIYIKTKADKRKKGQEK